MALTGYIVHIEVLWHVLNQVMEELVRVELAVGIIGELRLGQHTTFTVHLKQHCFWNIMACNIE